MSFVLETYIYGQTQAPPYLMSERWFLKLFDHLTVYIDPLKVLSEAIWYVRFSMLLSVVWYNLKFYNAVTP